MSCNILLASDSQEVQISLIFDCKNNWCWKSNNANTKSSQGTHLNKCVDGSANLPQTLVPNNEIRALEFQTTALKCIGTGKKMSHPQNPQFVKENFERLTWIFGDIQG